MDTESCGVDHHQSATKTSHLHWGILRTLLDATTITWLASSTSVLRQLSSPYGNHSLRLPVNFSLTLASARNQHSVSLQAHPLGRTHRHSASIGLHGQTGNSTASKYNQSYMVARQALESNGCTLYRLDQAGFGRRSPDNDAHLLFLLALPSTT